MKFNPEEIKVALLVLSPESQNQLLISVRKNDKMILRVLIDSIKNEITVDRQVNLHEAFKEFKVKDGWIGL